MKKLFVLFLTVTLILASILPVQQVFATEDAWGAAEEGLEDPGGQAGTGQEEPGDTEDPGDQESACGQEESGQEDPGVQESPVGPESPGGDEESGTTEGLEGSAGQEDQESSAGREGDSPGEAGVDTDEAVEADGMDIVNHWLAGPSMAAAALIGGAFGFSALSAEDPDEPVLYTIKYDLDGGSPRNANSLLAVDSNFYLEGESAAVRYSDSVKGGMDFFYWELDGVRYDPGDQYTITAEDAGPSGEIVFKAVYTNDLKDKFTYIYKVTLGDGTTYTITYYCNNAGQMIHTAAASTLFIEYGVIVNLWHGNGQVSPVGGSPSDKSVLPGKTFTLSGNKAEFTATASDVTLFKASVTFEAVGFSFAAGSLLYWGEYERGTTWAEAGIVVPQAPKGYTITKWERETLINSVKADPNANTGDEKIYSDVLYRAYIEKLPGFEVTYEYTGEVPAEAAPAPAGAQGVDYGAPMTVAGAPPAVPGYTFHGWTTEDVVVAGGVFTMPENDVAFVGEWTRNVYSITYAYIGDVPTDADPAPAGETGVLFGAAKMVAGNPAAVSGWTFSGWKTEDVSVIDGSFGMPAGNVSFVGKWTRNAYAITYAYIGDVPVDADPAPTGETGVLFGAAKTVSDNPAVVSGYTFQGWTTEDVFVIDGSFGMPAGNVAFVGEWTRNVYAITYAYIGETPADADPAPAGETGVLFDAAKTVAGNPAAVSGWTFTGWTTEDVIIIDGSFDMPAGDVAFVGEWTRNAYVITYAYIGDVPADADQAPTDETGVLFGAAKTVAGNPAPVSGWTFTGWTTDDATVVDGSFDMPAGNVAFVGEWKKNAYAITYSYSGEAPADADPVPAAETGVLFGAAKTVAGNPAPVSGWTFTGWTTEDVSVIDGSFDMPAGNVAFVGEWTRNAYNITYAYIGDVPEDADPAPTGEAGVLFGAAKTVAGNPAAVSGFTFQGWATEDVSVIDGGFGMPAGNVAFVGEWTRNAYNITYTYIGDVPADADPAPTGEAGVLFDAAKTVADNPAAVSGWTFSGWTTEDVEVADGGFRMPAADVEFTGSWTQIEYTVIYAPGAQGTWTAASQTYPGLHYGDATPKFAGNTARDHKDGYTFSRWSPRVENAVTRTITYTALWTAVGGGAPPTVTPVTPPPIPPAATPPTVPPAIPPAALPAVPPAAPPVVIAPPEPPITPAPADIAPEPAEISPEPAPLGTIPEVQSPLAPFSAWALLNLILTIVTGIVAAALIVTYFRRKDDEKDNDPDYDQKVKRRLGLRLLAVAATVIAVILFILTEDMTLPMAFIDKWTIFHIVITVATVILAILSRKKYEEEYLGTERA